MSSEAHRPRVPVDQRWLGLERRSLAFAAVPLVVLALWAWVMPWVADQVAWDDPVLPGEVIQVADNVTMTAPPGWGVVSGLRTTDDVRDGEVALTQTVLVKDGVVFSVSQGDFTGTSAELLDQAELITAADTGDGFEVRGAVGQETTAAGLRGVTQNFTSGRGVGSLTAFVVDDVGVELQVVGPRTQMVAQAAEVADMIDSLAADTEETS